MLRWLNIILVLVTLTCYLTPLINPQYVWPVAILGLFCPWLILGNILMALFWAITGKKQFWVNFACIALGWVYISSLANIPGNKPVAKEGELELKVLSFNCRNFRPVGQTAFMDPKDVGVYLAEQGADLICLQEFPFGQKRSRAYQAAIKESTQLNHFYQDPAGQLAIFSRYPVGRKGANFYTNRANGYQFAELRTDFGKIRLYNIHLQSNAITGMANQVADSGNLQEKDTWITIKGMLGRYGRAAKIRSKQTKEITEHLRRSPYPVILCGDFNDVPVSYVYRQYRHYLKDAFTSQGRGLGTTYAGSLPGLRIDHIMHSDSFLVKDFTTLATAFSDHRAVSTELIYNGKMLTDSN